MVFVSKRGELVARFLDTADERRKFHPGLREVRNHFGRCAGILEEVNPAL
jgi:hypothetical protein